MLEMILPVSEHEETGEVVFLYDPATESDLMGSNITLTKFGTVAVDSNYLIDGLPTLRIPTTTSGLKIDFAERFNFGFGSWTLEWAEYNTEASASNYKSGVCMYKADKVIGAAAEGMLSRWGDNGFLNRFQIGTRFNSQGRVYSPAVNKSNTYNVLTRWAMVCTAGYVKLYKDGVFQLLATGTGGAYTGKNFPIVESMDDLAMLTLGYFTYNGSGVSAARMGNIGRVRLSNYARYSGDYTPGPLEIE